MHRTLLVLAVPFALAGCHFGPHVSGFEPARRPQGVSVDGRTRGAALAGELLEVRDKGLLLLAPSAGASGGRVVFASFAAIQEAHFKQMRGSCDLKDGAPPIEQVRERLRWVSRFPQGVSAEVLRLLLEAHGQSQVVDLQ